MHMLLMNLVNKMMKMLIVLVHLGLKMFWSTRDSKGHLSNDVIKIGGICQKPLFAANLLNIVAPDSYVRVSSTYVPLVVGESHV